MILIFLVHLFLVDAQFKKSGIKAFDYESKVKFVENLKFNGASHKSSKLPKRTFVESVFVWSLGNQLTNPSERPVKRRRVKK